MGGTHWLSQAEQDTSPKGQGHWGASEAWGLTTVRPGTEVVLCPPLQDAGGMINVKTQGSNVSGTCGNSTIQGKEGVLVLIKLDRHLSQRLGEEGSLCPQMRVKKWPLPDSACFLGKV